MPTIQDLHRTPAFGGRGNMTDWLSVVDVGAAGAATPDGSKSDPGFTWTNAGAGLFTVTFPPSARGVLVPLIVRSAAPTVFTAHVTALDITAGTATVRYNNAAGAATNPANGDIIGCIIKAGMRQ
jgi:hypothetical protein